MDKERRKYIFLISISVIGIILGIVFSNILNSSDKLLVSEKLTTYFNNIKNNISLNYMQNFKNIFLGNTLYILIIGILGLSIIGLFLNIFILFFKSFSIGFCIGSIINIYYYKGIIGGILYVFPHTLINLFVIIILVYYANNFSIKLFRFLFMKKEFKFQDIIKKYGLVYLYGLGVIFLTSLLETFLSPIILKIFTSMID